MDKYDEIIHRHRAEQARINAAQEAKRKKLDIILFTVSIILLFALVYLLYDLFNIHLESEKLKHWLETH
ncbi:hypothetical protein DMB68_13640 [Flavobacterium hydrophilum]|uniref:Uncharacterized protein n=1 Tax=Flavobacterium hydrophilum TaxID=2211445 RepID=A0A2V4C028_9FLAO|nr:hypothetical protein DMB68_13640 [Flavobacterium hydrophilum]